MDGQPTSPGGRSDPKRDAKQESSSIRFGIDQILGGSSDKDVLQKKEVRSTLDLDHFSGGGSYHPASRARAGAAPFTSLPGSFLEVSLPYEEAHSYGLNLSPSPGEVIRVPAHRPVAPVQTARIIPWMSNNQQFAKDSLTAHLTPLTVVRRVGHPYQNRTPPKRKKPRTSFSRHQISELEKRFYRQKYLASAERTCLAKTLKMSDGQVKTWFQNRRTKWRRQTAEEREAERQQAGRLMVQLQHEAFQRKFSDSCERRTHGLLRPTASWQC